MAGADANGNGRIGQCIGTSGIFYLAGSDADCNAWICIEECAAG